MRWTTGIGITAGLLALAGCGYGYRMIAVQARYSPSSRPDPSYFCYDCHGYRYFDPYYDFCVRQGFRYRWTEHPQAMTVYRNRYVQIREAHPDYGRYRYQAGYRSRDRYRSPRDYDSWRARAKRASTPETRKGREGKAGAKDGRESGSGKKRKSDQRKGPRDTGSRLTLPGVGS